MKQQVDVTVKFTLEVDAEKDKQVVAEDVIRAVHLLFVQTSYGCVHDILSRYAGGNTMINTISAELVEVKEESEIYETEPTITYYLFGHEAVREYVNGNTDGVKEKINNGDGSVYAHNENDHSGILVEQMDGWHESIEISKEDYDNLNTEE